jgi:hypothetical protein
MAKSSTAALQRALEKPQPAAKPEPIPAAVAYYTAPSRAGKVPINVYLDADYKRSLRLLQAVSGRSMQAIVGEALNDVFAKHGVPTVTEGTPTRAVAALPAISADRRAEGKPRQKTQARGRQ